MRPEVAIHPPNWGYLGHWYATPGRKLIYRRGGFEVAQNVCVWCPLGSYVPSPKPHPSSSDPISNFVASPDIDERLRTNAADRDAFIAAMTADLEAIVVAEEVVAQEKALTILEQAMRDIADADEWGVGF